MYSRSKKVQIRYIRYNLSSIKVVGASESAPLMIEQCNVVFFPKVCFIQSCHTSSFLRYSLIHAFYETTPSGTHSTAMIAASFSADNRDNPFVTDLEKRHCGLWTLSVPPDVGNPLILNSPVENHFFWLVVTLSHICQCRHFSHPIVPRTTSLGVLRHRCSGEGHLSGRVLKVQPKVSFAVALVRAQVISLTVRARI